MTFFPFLFKPSECFLKPSFYKAYVNGVAPLFELHSLLGQINQIKTIIDIGSNKGQFSILAKSLFAISYCFWSFVLVGTAA